MIEQVEARRQGRGGMNRILVVLPNWFGETLFATPFIRALRLRHPQAHLAAMGVARCQEVLAHNPHLNDFILCDERGEHRSLRAKRRLIATLQDKRFDAAYVLRRSLTRTWLLLLAGIPTRIGFAHFKSGWLLTSRVPEPPAQTHKGRAYLRLLSGPDEPRPDVRYELFLSEAERAEAAALLRAHGVVDGEPFIVLHPGANWAHKRWLPERFAQLADRLSQSDRRWKVVITGAPEDEPLIQAMRREMACSPVVLAGRTSLRQAAGCLAQARLVISNDTGVLHVAAALGRPVVALYGPTSPAITGPLGDPHQTIVIHHPDCCPVIPCYKPDHPGYPGMASITMDEVAEAALQMLEVRSRR